MASQDHDDDAPAPRQASTSPVEGLMERLVALMFGLAAALMKGIVDALASPFRKPSETSGGRLSDDDSEPRPRPPREE